MLYRSSSTDLRKREARKGTSEREARQRMVDGFKGASAIGIVHLPSRLRDLLWASRSKFDRLRRPTAGFATSALGRNELRSQWPARPAPWASYPVLVHRLAPLIQASFRARPATTPLRFSSSSPPPGRAGDFHPPAAQPVRHASKKPAGRAGGIGRQWSSYIRSVGQKYPVDSSIIG
jgi:hypothetical protein